MAVYWWGLALTFALWAWDKNVLGLHDAAWVTIVVLCVAGGARAWHHERRQKKEAMHRHLRADQRKHEELVSNGHKTRTRLDSLRGDVHAGTEKVLSAIMGKDVARLAEQAEELAEDMERFHEAQLAKVKIPPPPYFQLSRGHSFHGMQMYLAFKEQFGKRFLDLHDACAARHIHDRVFDALSGEPTGSQAIWTTINGLRALSKTLRAEEK